MDAFESYRRELGERDLARASRARYQVILRQFQEWLQGRQPTPELGRGFLAYMREQGYSSRTIEVIYAGLRGFFAHLQMEFKVKLRKVRSLPPYTDQAAVERLLAEAERWGPPELRHRNYALILTGAHAGLRRGEAVGLKVGSIDFRRKVVRVWAEKTQTERVIPLTNRLALALWERCRGKRPGDRVFNINARQVDHITTRLAQRVGLEHFTYHSLRHFYATALLERQVNVSQVQRLLGHSSLMTTSQYLSVTDEGLQEAVARLDSPVPTPASANATMGGRVTP